MTNNPNSAQLAAQAGTKLYLALAKLFMDFMESHKAEIVELNKLLRDNWDYSTNKVSVDVAKEYFNILGHFDHVSEAVGENSDSPPDSVVRSFESAGFALTRIMEPELNFLASLLTDGEIESIGEGANDLLDKLDKRGRGEEDVPPNFI